ncbi:MAG: hypothetical protein HRT88_02270 [Lentisphaeraceae bacterium]|nr:hypothetical protein [Lentisphaeraceae bacterium]
MCQPEQLGHDYLKVSAVRILDDRRSLFIETRAILPAMTTHIYSKIKAADGSSLKLNLFATLNKLRPAHVAGQASHPGKIKVLLVPTKKFNGNTYQTITSFFDKVSGRATIKRAIGQTVAYKKEELSYAWIKSNIIDKQCIMCHAPGTQHDFSSYEKLMHKVNLTEPEDSPFYGMVKTESMPVFPLPTVHKEMQEAILEWIKLGAPK